MLVFKHNLIVCLALVVSSIPAQQLNDNTAVTFMIVNDTGGAVSSLTLDYGGVGGDLILDNVSLPPTASPMPFSPPGAASPLSNAYTPIRLAPDAFLISFGDPVLADQWVAVTLNVAGGGSVPGYPSTALWDGGIPAGSFCVPPPFVLNEISTANPADWIEILNLGGPRNLGEFRLRIYEDPGFEMTLPLPQLLLQPCQAAVVSDEGPLPVAGDCGLNPAPVLVSEAEIGMPFNIPWNTTVEGAVYLVWIVEPPAPSASCTLPVGTEVPVDSLAFGFLDSTRNVHPEYPVSSPIHNRTDDTPPIRHLSTNTPATPSVTGMMFDMVNPTNYPIVVTDLDLRIRVTIGSVPIEIYSKPGSYVGSESMPLDWNSGAPVATTTLSSPAGLVPLGLDLDLVIPAGETRAFYVTTTGAARLRTLTAPSVVADDHLEIHPGIVVGYSFSPTATVRGFNGRVHYHTRDAVTLYRVENGSRFDADSWHNAMLPENMIEPLSLSSAAGATSTPGCLNPGQSVPGCTPFPGPRLRVSKSPLIIHVDGGIHFGGADPTVVWFASRDVRATQNGGAFAGLNPIDSLLFWPLALGSWSYLNHGTATLPSPCGSEFRTYELNLGEALTDPTFAALLPIEISAMTLSGPCGCSSPTPVITNVVRVH